MGRLRANPACVAAFCWQKWMPVLPPDDIDWVRHVNGRWLVRSTFRADAKAYLDHLASTDPDRLRISCGRARRLARSHRDEDPKPWFYAGLFSLATPEEARRHLRGHDFTIACIPGLADTELGSFHQGNVGVATWEKIARIRSAITALDAESAA